MSENPQGEGGREATGAISCGIPVAPGALGMPTATSHAVPLPVPIQATEAQDREQGEGGEDQDEGQAPHGQHFRVARKEEGALAAVDGKAGGSGGGVGGARSVLVE